MRFFHIFLTTSAMLSVSAIPMPVKRIKPYGPNRRHQPTPLLEPLQDPKVNFPVTGGVPRQDQDDTRKEVFKDFRSFGIEDPAGARKTQLAHVPNDWVYLENCQSLKLRYCEGKRPTTRTVIGGERTIYRPIPPETPLVLSFNQDVSHKGQIRGLITKHYNAFPANSPYRRATVTRVEEGWRPGGGNTGELHDHVIFTSHTAENHGKSNMIGEPHVIRRPLTVSFGPAVDPATTGKIEKKIRRHHKTIASDGVKSSNVAMVNEAPYWNANGKVEIQPQFYKWPERPGSDELIVDHGKHPILLT